MVLVDTSVWIDFFKGKEPARPLNELIESNTICINDLILAELIPSINHKKEYELKELLESVYRVTVNIDWNSIIAMQTINLKNGINNVGISDLLIVQNAIDNDLEVFAFDNHFKLMNKLFGFKSYMV
jgi:predicted nucleic acid-binding protein